MKYLGFSFPANVAFKFSSKLSLALLKGFYFIVSLLYGRKWSKPLENFEEEPAKFKFLDLLYLGYKYYYKPHIDSLTPQSIEQVIPLSKQLYEQSELKLCFAGDIMPAEVMTKQSLEMLWSYADGIIDGHVNIANLEMPFDNSKKYKPVDDFGLTAPQFCINDSFFDLCNNSKFQVLSCANNHSLDSGEDSIIATTINLEKRNIVPLGVYKTQEESNGIKYIESKGFKIAFIAFTFSFNGKKLKRKWLCDYLPLNTPNCDYSWLKSKCQTAKNEGADIVVVVAHSGNAYQTMPSAHHENNVKRVIENCDIDIFVNIHPHIAQKVESFSIGDRKVVVAWSLGDFIGYDPFTISRLSRVLKVGINRVNGVAKVSNLYVEDVFLLMENKDDINNFYLLPFDKFSLGKYDTMFKISNLDLTLRRFFVEYKKRFLNEH